MKKIRIKQIAPCGLSDLTGKWKGKAENDLNSISLHLDVNAIGKVRGSGVRAEWDIDSGGRVRGGGSFAFLRESNRMVVKAMWEMNLHRSGKTLSGTFHVADDQFGECSVRLKRNENDA